MHFQANRYEQVLAKRAEGISQNLHRALQTHNRYANDDITTALLEHARSSIMYERQLLRELEALRGDIDNAAKKVVLSPNGVPKPTIIPPLEDYSERPPGPESAPSAPLSNGFHKQLPSQIQPPHTAGIPSQGGPSYSYISHRSVNTAPSLPSPVPSQPPPTSLSTASETSHPSPVSAGPLSPVPSQLPVQRQSSPHSPVAGPSYSATPYSPIPKQEVAVPPLGGRFIDGTKSMFLAKPTSSPRPSPLAASASTSNVIRPSSAGGPTDPLRNVSYRSPLHDPLHHESNQPQQRQDIDPLAAVKPRQMSSSMRVQTPSRPRLDPREAASKLANMF